MEIAKEQGIARSDLDADGAAEWLIRVSVSLLTVPSARSPAAERRYLRRFLVPAFLADLGTRGPAEVVNLPRKKTPRA